MIFLRTMDMDFVIQFGLLRECPVCLITGMVLRLHTCDHIFNSFLLGYGSRVISQISQCRAQFWEATLLGYKIHPLALNEACTKKYIDVIEFQRM